MPFPNKEIMEAYENSTPFPQSSFAQDEGFWRAYENWQDQYALIMERKDPVLEKQLRELIGFIREANEYETEHAFAEGWRMAKAENKNAEA